MVLKLDGLKAAAGKWREQQGCMEMRSSGDWPVEGVFRAKRSDCDDQDAQMIRLGFAIRARLWLPFAISLAGIVVSSSAEAGILSASAVYHRGLVVIRGYTTQPHEVVSLGQSRVQRSNQRGQFSFQLKRVPISCTVRLKTAQDTARVLIRNCPNKASRRTTHEPLS